MPNKWKTRFNRFRWVNASDYILSFNKPQCYFCSTVFIKCLHCIRCSKNNSCRCCSVRVPSSFFDPHSLALECSPPLLISSCVWLTHCSSSESTQEWVACSFILRSTGYEGSSGLKLFFANHKLCVSGLGLNLSGHTIPHLYNGNNNSNNIWDNNVASVIQGYCGDDRRKPTEGS